MDIDKLQEELIEEIRSQIETSKSIKYGSDEHSNMTDDITKLYKVALEYEKMKRESELKVQEEELTFERVLKAIISIASGVVIPIGGFIFDSIWMKRGFKFEQEGTYTSKTFQMFNRFRHRKGDR